MSAGRRALRQASAARREASRYRRVLEELTLLATNRLLEHRDDVVAHQVVELAGAVLSEKRPHGREPD